MHYRAGITNNLSNMCFVSSIKAQFTTGIKLNIVALLNLTKWQTHRKVGAQSHGSSVIAGLPKGLKSVIAGSVRFIGYWNRPLLCRARRPGKGGEGTMEG